MDGVSGMSTFRLWAVGLVLGVAASLVLPYTFSYYGVPLLVAIGLAVTESGNTVYAAR